MPDQGRRSGGAGLLAGTAMTAVDAAPAEACRAKGWNFAAMGSCVKLRGGHRDARRVAGGNAFSAARAFGVLASRAWPGTRFRSPPPTDLRRERPASVPAESQGEARPPHFELLAPKPVWIVPRRQTAIMRTSTPSLFARLGSCPIVVPPGGVADRRDPAAQAPLHPGIAPKPPEYDIILLSSSRVSARTGRCGIPASRGTPSREYPCFDPSTPGARFSCAPSPPAPAT